MRQVSGKPDVLRGLVQMDDPDHTAYRDIALPWFNPTWLAGFETWVADCAREAVARITGLTEVFDFAAEVAVTFPMRVTMHILGLPATDDQFILKLARGLTGAEDPDRALSDRPAESIRLAGVGMRDYFNRITSDRRANPTDDLSSAIANARIHGMPIQTMNGSPTSCSWQSQARKTRVAASRAACTRFWRTPRSGRSCEPT